MIQIQIPQKNIKDSYDSLTVQPPSKSSNTSVNQGFFDVFLSAHRSIVKSPLGIALQPTQHRSTWLPWPDDHCAPLAAEPSAIVNCSGSETLVQWQVDQWLFQDPKLEVLYHISGHILGVYPLT